jgi:hypothetical protein
VALLLLLPGLARAHEGEQWINDKQLHDPISREFCCGPQDCRILPDEAVEIVPGGYQVVIDGGTNFVPENRTLPFSPDGHYHICVVKNDQLEHIRCFITPPSSS